MATTDSITIHCWLPDVQSIALGIGAGGAVFGTVLLETVRGLSWLTNLEVLAGLLFLGFCLTYCRVTVTPWEVRVLGSGAWKGHYSCPLAEAAVWGYWVLPEQAAAASYYSPALDFSLEEDWDSGTPYVDVLFYGEQQFNCFRPKHFHEINAALETMKSRRLALEAPAG